jgi:hypothetical protein
MECWNIGILGFYSIVPLFQFQSPLFAFELRGSLLEVGFHAFLTVFAAEGLR